MEDGKEGKDERYRERESEQGNDKRESEKRTIYIEGQGRGEREWGERGKKNMKVR